MHLLLEIMSEEKHITSKKKSTEKSSVMSVPDTSLLKYAATLYISCHRKVWRHEQIPFLVQKQPENYNSY